MKKLLYLFLVFGLFACSNESADDDDTNNNDPIIGTWSLYYDEEDGNDDGIWDGEYIGGDAFDLFEADGSYSYTDPSFPSDNYEGLWLNLGGNTYQVTQVGGNGDGDWEEEFEFYCNNNIKRWAIGSTNQVQYYHKIGYNYSDCNEFDYLSD